MLDYLLDEALMRKLEQERYRGRDDYPVRQMWNTLVSGVVFQHLTVEALLRELRRNVQMRQVCGFELVNGLKAVPNSWDFSRFFAQVMAHRDLMQQVFDTLADRLTELLPDYRVSLAVDGKALPSYARGKAAEAAVEEHADRRRDTDGEWGVHEYRGIHENGTP